METPSQETLIACRVCNQVFFDNKNLFDHYTRLHDGSLESSVNDRNVFSGASHITCFTSVSFTDVNSSASCNFGSNSSQRVFPPSDLSVGSNFLVPTPLRNFSQLRGLPSTPRSQLFPFSSLQLRGPPSTLRSQLFPFSSNLHSPTGSNMLPSSSKQSFSSSFRFASKPTGQPSFHLPASHTTPGISNPQFSKSTSKPTAQLNLHSPIDLGALATESMSGGTSSLPCTAKRSFLNSTGQSEVQNLVAGYTKPYIMQLEYPIEEMTVVARNDNGGDNFKPDDLDLTLKL